MTENKGPGLLAVFVGASGSGKSTLASAVFGPENVVSSDALRLLVSGGANDQQATRDAFDLLHRIVAMRCKRQLVTAVDSVALRAEHRAVFHMLAAVHGMPCVAIAVDTPLKMCLDRNAARERQVPEHVIRAQYQAFRRSLAVLPDEGFADVFLVRTLARSTGQHVAELAEWLAGVA